MREIITCQNFFDGEFLHGPSAISFEGGVVRAIEPLAGAPDFHLVSAGLVDIQVNGYNSWDVSRSNETELRALDDELFARGTTSWLGTLTTAPLEDLTASVATVDEYLRTHRSSGCCGIHLEGPFLGNAPGAHRPEWIIPFDAVWVAGLPPSVRVMTMAAEQHDAKQSVRQLVNQNIVVSIGHSRPNENQWLAVRAAGATMVTHLFNGMSGIHHRDDGLALYALTDDAVYTGLIADLAHVSSTAISLAFRSKSAQRICLVSDAVAWNSSGALKRGIILSDGVATLPNGTLAGSASTLADCVRHVVSEAGVSLSDALTAATSSPADAIGLPHLGRVRHGEPADLVAFDDSLHVVRAWRRLVSLRG